MNVFGTVFDYAGRLAKVRGLMADKGLEVILVNLWTNQYYFSGMYHPAPWYPIEVCDHTEAPLVIFRDPALEPVFFITYLTGIGVKEGTWIKDVRILDKEPFARYPWQTYLAQLLQERGLDRGQIGFEQDACVVSTFHKLQQALPAARFLPADVLLERVRMVKELAEITLIRESVAISEAGIQVGKQAAHPGVLESEVQKAVEIELKRRGAIKEIESMVQSGFRTANHRSNSSNWKKIAQDDLVTIDVGSVYQGYGSDLTRTWVVGRPTDLQNKIAADLRDVYAKTSALVKPGIAVRDIYTLGQREMSKAGYLTEEKAYPTPDKGSGNISIHGIGLSPMHDPPRAYDRDIPLAAGMTISLSCKARYPDFTIRFENDLLVTDSGSELLSPKIPWQL